MSHWIVTGGAGFVGSHLTDDLIAAGDRVTVIDDFSNGHTANLAMASRSDRLTVVRGDAGEASVMGRVLGMGACGIFHLAAAVKVQDCIDDWLGAHRRNATAAVCVMSMAAQRATAVPVVYASSAAVYGDVGRTPCQEEMPERPLSPYGADKLAIEHHARAFWHVHRLPTYGMRFFNIYGERQSGASPYAGVLARFINNLHCSRPHGICGDGLQSRDFVQVRDVVVALRAAMDRLAETPGCHVSNVCTGRATTVRQAAALIDRLHGRDTMTVPLPARAGEIRHSIGCPERMGRALGTRARVALSDGLAPLVAATAHGSIA